MTDLIQLVAVQLEYNRLALTFFKFRLVNSFIMDPIEPGT